MPFVAICAAWTVIQWSKDIGTAPRNTVMIRTH
jgi:hypothetical protein